MSISSALVQAGSGLSAAARAIQIASGNIANAQTPGYAPRSLNLGAAILGGQGAGVRVLGAERQTDPVLRGLLDGAGAARAGAEAQGRFWESVETALGVPGAPGSLATALDGVLGALTLAADRPDLDSRLAAALGAAQGLAARLNTLERAVQDQRLAADGAIADGVARLNEGLERLDRLNREIVSLRAAGQPTFDLDESREALVADLSQIVPLRTQVRTEGRMVVFSEGGVTLLDLQPARIGFQPVPGMEAGMTLAGGALSGLTVNGRPVATGPGGPLGGAALGAQFALRDGDGPAVQAALDALAASLAARFQDPATDPTAAPGSAGLFTDAGNPVVASPVPGLAGRLRVNPAVDPAAGGALFRLRDGLGAAAPGPAGDPAQIGRWLGALERPVSPAPGVAARSFGQDLDETLSALGQTRQAVEDRLTYARAVEDGLRQQDLAGGVDIDAEMRRLMAIETAYAANARVIQVADDLLRILMEI